jgi:hypothetical protein
VDDQWVSVNSDGTIQDWQQMASDSAPLTSNEAQTVPGWQPPLDPAEIAFYMGND